MSNRMVNNTHPVVLVKYNSLEGDDRSSVRETYSESSDFKDVSDTSSHKKERAK